jgi:ABC-type polysaccharide/polyol phosphate export permease
LAGLPQLSPASAAAEGDGKGENPLEKVYPLKRLGLRGLRLSLDDFPLTCYIPRSAAGDRDCSSGRLRPSAKPQAAKTIPHGRGTMQAYLGAVWRCRYFWLSLVRMDLRHRYRGSVLGLGWSLLHPIAMTVILCTVFHQLFHTDQRYYAPFLLSGLACWNYIVLVTIQGSLCFLHGEAYIRQFPAPMAIYPLRTALSGGIHFVLALLVSLAAAWLMRGGGHWLALVSLLPTVALLLVLGWALAVLAGLANVYFQDTRHLCEVGFQMLFYATPIIYEVRLLDERSLGWIIRWNPLVPLLQLVRDPLLEGRLPPLSAYAAASAFVAAAAVAAAAVLARLQRRLIFHL